LSGFGDKIEGFEALFTGLPSKTAFGSLQVVDLKAFFHAGTGFAPVQA